MQIRNYVELFRKRHALERRAAALEEKGMEEVR